VKFENFEQLYILVPQNQVGNCEFTNCLPSYYPLIPSVIFLKYCLAGHALYDSDLNNPLLRGILDLVISFPIFGETSCF